MPFDDQPLNILYLVWEYPPKLVGGLGTYATEMTRKFVERGHNVVVFTMNKRPEEGDPLPTRELYRGVEVHRPLLLDASDILPSFVADDLRRWGPHIRFFADIMLYNILSASKVVNDLVPREGRRFDLVVAHDWLSIMGGML
ncbi:glycosyltransferase, partial [archaeon]|nr:glycosyltransferase [archaeon]